MNGEKKLDCKKLSQEYELSAQKIKERIDKLKDLSDQKNYDDEKRLNERIEILTAEYYHLIQTAGYLLKYYDKTDTVNISKKTKMGA